MAAKFQIKDGTNLAPSGKLPQHRYQYNLIMNWESHDAESKLVISFGDEFCKKFENADCHVFFPPRDMLGGDSYIDILCKTVQQSKYTIVIFTPGFIENNWCKYSHQFAMKDLITKKEGRYFIPVSLGVKSLPKEVAAFRVVQFENDLKNTKNVESWKLLKKTLCPEHVENQTAKGDLLPGRTCEAEHQKQTDDNQLQSDILRKAMGAFLPCNHYILILGPLSNLYQGFERLSEVNWLAVFDFDVESKVTGVLSLCDDLIVQQQQSLYVTTWADENPRAVSDRSIQWCMVRGHVDNKSSRLDGNDHRSWINKAGRGLGKHLEQIERFCLENTVPKVLVIWGHDEKNQDLLSHLCRFLQKVEECLNTVHVSITLCMKQKELSLESITGMHNMKKEVNIEHEINLTPEEVCIAMESFLAKKVNTVSLKYSLPTDNRTNEIEMDDAHAAWVAEDMEVLYIQHPHIHMSLEELKKEEREFFRGCTMPWKVWFSCEGSDFDIARDVGKNFIQEISRVYLKPCKAGVIRLHHLPGSGGSTLGQRLLWDLRMHTPCVQLRTNTNTPLEETVSRFQYLYKITENMPIVCLVDGEDESRVRKLHFALHGCVVIIIHVMRSVYSRKQPESDEKDCWLSGNVSEKEAKLLAFKYGKQCEEKKKKVLEQLAVDVEQGKNHQMYEFGLTVYLHEHVGVKKYVKGYLAAPQKLEDLRPWQKVLGFLSIVYYYGHCPIPLQFFGQLLKLSPKQNVSLCDLHEQATALIGENTIDSNVKQIQICNYFVAKEILEQLLNPRDILSTYDQSNTHFLSREARKNIHSLAISFLEYAGGKQKRTRSTSSTVTRIVTRTFILRDNRDIDPGSFSDDGRKKKKKSIADDSDGH